MKFLKLLSLFAMPFFMGQQVTRFVYQASIKTDSTDAKSVKTENANLDVSPTKSIFYSDNQLKRDSLIGRAFQTRSFNFDRSQMENLQSNLNFVIEKNYTDQSQLYKSRIGRDQYSYTETPQFSWKILPETVKIGDYNTQKAEMKYGGRTWNAWFTTDIPIQDGPYKFGGLPGLIVKIEDTAGNYSFDLMQSKKIAAPAEFTNRGNTVKLSKKDFNKQFSAYRKDPVTFMQSNANFGGGGGIAAPQRAGGGNRQGPSPQDRKDQEERLKQSVLKFNNLIELN
ncbi:GLPGLI family protein [Halpernia frigidisoli]|uniref:GLPGLI family protein n=1 Tax=Halpernia frigidisoli TaxID=1125876 RepID=A0A1I3GWX1_9FLAO|nr:GLPGLI family protein [Halpernia frigidisoli]SFI27842.1 GLPGLI family protein [Halpernia frigidisoli]